MNHAFARSPRRSRASLRRQERAPLSATLLCLAALLSPTFSAEARADGLVRDDSYQLVLETARSDAGGGGSAEAEEAVGGEAGGTAALGPSDVTGRDVQGEAGDAGSTSRETQDGVPSDQAAEASAPTEGGQRAEPGGRALLQDPRPSASSSKALEEGSYETEPASERLVAAAMHAWPACVAGGLSLAAAGALAHGRRRASPHVRTSYRRRHHYRA